jgi:hypothetical protein
MAGFDVPVPVIVAVPVIIAILFGGQSLARRARAARAASSPVDL